MFTCIDALSYLMIFFFFFSSRRRHTRYWRDWSSDVCSSDLVRRLHEKERLLPVRVVAHLARVLGVVAADAVDAADGEQARLARDRHGDGRQIGRASCRERV